jgi:drug/metabolite transporter (DMT)-like permease
MYNAQLRWKPIAVLMLLALIWGANMAIIKIGTREIAPLFMAGLRSLVAGVCLYIWMKAKGIVIFPSRIFVVHGIVIGLFFGAEFGLIYVGLEYTLTSRVYVLLYTAPFFAAIEAHFFLEDDRLNIWKITGLLLAFGGVVALFVRDLGSFSLTALPGDLMVLLAGVLWASTTVYIKKYLAHQGSPLQTLFYQVFFSAPLLFVMSIAFEDQIVSGFSLVTGFSIFYQCIIVAFLSYLVWFELIHRYPVSLLHAFSFFTPILGVFLSGIIIMGEVITPNLVAALVMVSIGMVLINHRPAVNSAGKKCGAKTLS